MASDGLLALPYYDNWYVEIGSSTSKKDSDNIDPTVIRNKDNNDFSHINYREKGICDERSSQMESDSIFMGPHREKINESANKSTRKKTTNDKKVEWQRVKFIAKKSVRQLFKKKEKVDTTIEV